MAQKDSFVEDSFEPDKSDSFVEDSFVPDEEVESDSLAKRIVKKGYEKLMTPLLPDIDMGQTKTIYGRDNPIINKIWPGGLDIPSLKDIYHEIIQPSSAPIGLLLGGLEGAITGLPKLRGSLTKAIPEPLPKITPPEPTSLSVPEPKIGTPPFNTSQFGLHPSNEALPYPQNVVPNRLRAPSTNATVFDALLPENLKLNEQGAATPPTVSLKDPNRIATKPVTTPGGKYTFLDEAVDKIPNMTAEQEVLPKPGQASVKDISALTANVTSADQTLKSREITRPIADTLITAQDKKVQWIATTERELSELSSGLNSSSRILLGKLIDGQQIENAPLELQQRAQQARVILDQVHEMFPEGATRSGENVGYLENYFTHIQHQPNDIASSVSNILDHHFGVLKSKEIPLPVEGSEGIGDYFEKGTGHPSSPFVEERTGKNKDIIYDVNKVFPAYIESAAKVIFDKPAVELAMKHLDKVPDSNLKELATWYIKNYSRYDAEKGLAKAWTQWANSISRTTARSLLGFNTGLQTLHLARVPANLWPELGSKYTLYGLQQIGKNPIAAWTESAKLGLLQNEIRPFSFKTPMEKMDSISNFFSMADYIDKTAGYFGYKKKFMDGGMAEPEASLAALRETKRVSQTTDPARQMKLMSPKSNIAGGQVLSKLGWQFKTVPAKIVEQYVRIAQEAKDNPATAARMLAGIGLVLGANEGLRTFHLDPMHMMPSGVFGAFGDTVARVGRALAKGDVMTALKETALWATPGGKSLERQIKSGPSALQ